METSATNQKAPARCASCGEQLMVRSAFCHACGTPVDLAGGKRSSSLLPWSVAGLAMIALVALMAGRAYGRRQAEPADRVTLGNSRAPDISGMSPEERAQRLLSRVIAYASAGRDDSAAFFAPMAMGAFEALAPLSTHHRFDLGLVAFAVGDMTTAVAQADSIVAVEPANLLGLALAMQSADVTGDTARRNAFARRLLAAESKESARKLPEYAKHASELRAAIESARSRGS